MGCFIVFGLLLAQAANAASYYVDSAAGDDSNTGTSTSAAWKTLAKVNGHTFAAGDQILLKAGLTYSGQLWPKGSGAPNNPILINMYGTGAKPQIIGTAADSEVVKLLNQQQWEISNLDVTGLADSAIGISVTVDQPTTAQIPVDSEGIATAKHFKVANCKVHNIKGNPHFDALTKGYGIHFNARRLFFDDRPPDNWDTLKKTHRIYEYEAGVRSRFDDVEISDNIVDTVQGYGIDVVGGFVSRGGDAPAKGPIPKGTFAVEWAPSKNVLIARNIVKYCKTTDIYVSCTDGARIEHNTAAFGGQPAPASSVGIWCWSADNTQIRFNEVYGRTGVLDGQAFDADWNSLNTIIEYNYSHDNEGGFVALFAKTRAALPGNVKNNGTIVRYNISQNDGRSSHDEPKYHTRYGEVFMLSGQVTNAQFYNNTWYLSGSINTTADFQIFHGDQPDDWPANISFANNVFYVMNGCSIKFLQGAGPKGITYVKNALYTTGSASAAFLSDVPSPPEKQYTPDPLFVSPGTGGTGDGPGIDHSKVAGYKLQASSPMKANGTTVANNGGRDFFGNAVPASTAPDIGAFQYSKP